MKTSWALAVALGALTTSWALSASGFIAVAKDENGALVKMGQSSGIVFCGRHGGRLPTSREFALYGVRHGAAGIRETKFTNATTGSPGLAPEWAANQAEKYYAVTQQLYPDWNSRIDFYYNSDGYKPNDELPATPQYWTANVNPGGSDMGGVFQEDGGIAIKSRADQTTDQAAVACVTLRESEARR